MSTTPPSDDMPFGDDTDEAISALLDGELAAFASDRGLAEADVRGRLTQWPGFGGRLAELVQARDVLSAPVPGLDEVERRRMVRNATAVAAIEPNPQRPANRARIFGAIAAVAAAVLAVVVIGVAVFSDGSDSSSSKTASAGHAHGTMLMDQYSGSIGEISGTDALRQALVRGAAPSVPEDGAGGAATAPTITTLGGTAVDMQAERCAKLNIPKGAEVNLLVDGTYEGKPVIVVAFPSNGRELALVADLLTCDIVYSASL